MWVVGLLGMLAGLAVIGGCVFAVIMGVRMMKRAKAAAMKSESGGSDTVVYMETQKRKTWGLTLIIIGVMFALTALIWSVVFFFIFLGGLALGGI